MNAKKQYHGAYMRIRDKKPQIPNTIYFMPYAAQNRVTNIEDTGTFLSILGVRFDTGYARPKSYPTQTPDLNFYIDIDAIGIKLFVQSSYAGTKFHTDYLHKYKFL